MVRKNNSVVLQLRHNLERYHALKQHDKQEAAFKDALYALQKWQGWRMRQTHQTLLDDEKYRVATEFFLEDIYGGADLRGLAHQAERAINAALRILPEKVMNTAVYALELNALSAELDERLAECLFFEMGAEDITEDGYTEAFRESASKEQRQRQVELAKLLAQGLDKYVRSRVVYSTFKLVRRPAERAGIGELYGFMGKGFDAMRPMRSASEVICRIVDREAELIDMIYSGYASPYNLGSNFM